MISCIYIVPPDFVQTLERSERQSLRAEYMHSGSEKRPWPFRGAKIKPVDTGAPQCKGFGCN